jgi:hypothetical protein
MNTYFILLSNSGDDSALALDENTCADLVRITGVRSLDVYLATGEFEIVLICEAPDNGPIRILYRELRGWIISAILASHVGSFCMTDGSNRNWVNPPMRATEKKALDEA